MRFGVPTGPSRYPALVVLFSATVAGWGCAHSDSVADRHIREMRESLGRLESEQDRVSARLELVEGAEDPKPTRAPAAKAPAATGAGSTNAVRTVQIGDADDTGENEDPNDPNARPEIRLQGQGGASRPVRSKTTRRGRDAELRTADSDEASAANSKSDSSRPSILDPDAKKAYDAALALVNGKQYDRALEALSAFLTRWPDHPYAENALYWRGESYYARGEYLRAAEQFEAVLARGLGQKAPDALLKIGLCHERLGSSDRANEYWERLRRDYPRSDAAKKVAVPSRDAERGSKNDRGNGPKESR